MIAENNHEYQEQDSTLITGWHKVVITKITEPRVTQSGDATGFWINLHVRVGNKTLERGVWLSFDHPNEFVTAKSQNIGAMLRMMFPAVTADEDYVGCSFWLLFKTYTDKKTQELKESFFDFKRNVSFNGKETLDGHVIVESVPSAPPQASKAGKPNVKAADSADDGNDDVPF